MSNELDVDALAQEIRRVDGKHDLGAGQLAEALMPFLIARAHPPTDAGVSEAISLIDKHIAAAVRCKDAPVYSSGVPMEIYIQDLRELRDDVAALSTAIPAGDGVPPGMVLDKRERMLLGWMFAAFEQSKVGQKITDDLKREMRDANRLVARLSTVSTAGKG